MPAGDWMLAEYDAAAIAVTVAYPWGACCLVFANGRAIYTSECKDSNHKTLCRRMVAPSAQSGAITCANCAAGSYAEA